MGRADRDTKSLTFFNVFNLCKDLDSERTDQFRKRTTKIYICQDRPCFRVSHIEDGVITAQAIELTEDDDIELEILSLHAIVDDKVRNNKVVYDDDWIYPVAF